MPILGKECINGQQQMRVMEKEKSSKFSIASHPAKVLCGEIDWGWLDLEKGSQCERELCTF